MDWLPLTELVELLEVVLVNLVLSADNAIVVGIAVAGLPARNRLRVMAIGIAGATVLRVVFAVFTVQLLAIVGLLLAGGLLLLWICWKLWGELRMGQLTAEAAASDTPKSTMAAIWQIVVADVSMSLDNVLAVAGVARHHLSVLVAPAESPSVDRVFRVGRDLVRGAADDLGRRARDLAARALMHRRQRCGA